MFDGGGYVKNTNIKNNVAINNKRIINWGYPTDPVTNTNITNNVWHYTTGFSMNPAPPTSSNVVIANNYPGATAGLAAAGDAGLQLSGTVPNPFYAPISSSALVVDKGTASISSTITLTGFTGTAPDIGRYEWVGNLVDRTTNPGGGTITARASIHSGENQTKAFDDSTNSKWLDNAGTPTASNPSWITYQFANAGYAVQQYTITSANDEPNRDPKSWTLQGSTNGTNWTNLDSQSGQAFASRYEKKTYSFTNSTVYKYYRLQITENKGAIAMTQLSEIELLSP